MKRISTYRDALMGLAILWIVLFHAEVTFPAWCRPLMWLKETGYGGVDIFLFLSGMGLYYSLQKNPSLSRFYRNRAVRILPTYWIVVLGAALMELVLLHRRTPILELFYMASTVGFWLNAAKFDWYIPSLVVLYAVFPFFYSWFAKSRNKVLVWVAWAAFGWAISLLLINSRWDYLLIFTTRIPVFFLGAVLAYRILSNKASAKTQNVIVYGIALFGLVALGAAFKMYSPDQRWHNGSWWYAFLPLTPGLCYGAAFLIDKAAKGKTGKKIIDVLAWCGRYSLEIYLVHTLVFGLHKETARYFSFDQSGITAFGVYFLVSLPLAWLLHQVMETIIGNKPKEERPLHIASRYVTLFRGILALSGWAALTLQCYIVQQNAARQGISPLMAFGNFLSYFTILTNAVIALSLTLGLLAPNRKISGFFSKPSVQTSLTGCIILVSLIYHAALARAWNPQGLQWWTNFFLHDAIPSAFVVNWLLFVPKGNLEWRQPLTWMIYPLAYLGWMMGRGAFTGFYPYPFADVTWHGYPRVLANLGVLVIAFALGFYFLVALDKWMAKYFSGIFLRK